MNQIKLLYIDLFCGAGGTSTGVEHAQLHGEKCAKVIACFTHGHVCTPTHRKDRKQVVFTKVK